MQTLHCLELIYCKNYFNLVKILVLWLFKMAANHTQSSDLNRGLSSKFWWLRSTNRIKFTEKCLMCTEKHLLVINK